MDEESIRNRLEALNYRDLQKEAKKCGVKARAKRDKLLNDVLKMLLHGEKDDSVAAATEQEHPSASYTTDNSELLDESDQPSVLSGVDDFVAAEHESLPPKSPKNVYQLVDDENVKPHPSTVTDASVDKNAEPNVSSGVDDSVAAATNQEPPSNSELLEENVQPSVSTGINDSKAPSTKQESISPKPAASNHRFIDLHQRATDQMIDIGTDQKRKEERHNTYTKAWTPRIDKLSQPKFTTPSKKLLQSPNKRRRSSTFSGTTPIKARRIEPGLTYPTLTPRLETLAQPKTPPRSPSRVRSASVSRLSYKPRVGAFHFVDTTTMTDEQFKEHQKRKAETRQS